MRHKISKIVFTVLTLALFSSCGILTTVWDSIKDRYEPYEFVGMEGNKVLVRFNFDSPSATEVWIAGSFNNWKADESAPRYPSVGLDNDPVIECERDPDTGFWTVTIPLEPGRYQFKYVLDRGRVWSEDMNTDTVDDGFGGNNSIIMVVAQSGDES